jgi:serine/threonine protein kinase
VSDPNTCSRCGYVFAPADDEPALAGLCPRCLAGGLGASEATELGPQTDNAKVPIDTIRPPLKPGMTFKGFEVLEVLGQGGMGVVYKARQQSLNRLVALKLLISQLAASEEFVARFEREAKVIASVNHPNVVQVYDFGKDDGLLYLVMEYVDGPTLEDVMKKKDLPRFLTAVRDVTKGLHRVHEAGLVHRDVKPSNILIAKDGTAKISDFGLAIETDGSQKLTQSGMFVGTPHYVSPEHAQGKKIDGRSDLYSLGVILFEGYAGRPPFQAPSATALLLKHVNEAPPALYKLAPQSPRPVQEIVRKLLAKNPAARHDTAASLVRDLDRAIEEGKAPPKAVPGTARKAAAAPAPTASNPMMKWIAGGIAAAALIAILAMVFGGGEKPSKKEEKPVAAAPRPAAPKPPPPPADKPVESEPVPVPPPPPPAPKPPEPKPQEPKPPGAIEEALKQGDTLLEQAKSAFEEGKSRNSVEALTDAAFKAEEAKEKYAAVQVVGTDELKAKAAEQIKLVQQLQKMAHESRLAILNAKGDRPSPAPAVPNPAPAAPGPAAPVAAAPVAPAVVAVKAPAPEASTLKEAEKAIREVYKAEFAKKSPADQLALAQKLLRQAGETADDPKARFVLLREARDLALQAGDLEIALAAIDDMALGFEIDVLSTKNSALTKLASSARSAEAASSLAEAFEDLARQALDADNFDIAVAASTRADAFSKSSPDPSFATRLQELRREIAVTKDEYLKVKGSIDKPGTGDPEALGRYYAFVKGDWDRGLEILAAAAKPPLNALAEKDLARSSDAAARAEVADGWWDLAEKEKSPFRKLRLQERTRLWYEACVGSLTGLTRTRAEKRLETLDALVRGPVDLLKYVDLTKDLVAGNWTRTSAGLTSGIDTFSRVQIPYVPPAEYDLTVAVERKEGQQDFYMGLVGADTQFGVMINAGNSTYCEVQALNGNLARYDSGVTIGRPSTILYQVRKNSLEVRVDGKRILSYKGDLAKGSMFPQWAVPDKKTLFVGSHGTVHVVTRMLLTTVSGKGRALRAASGSLGLPPAVSSARGPVDVLGLLDPRTDAVTGEWTSRGKSLVTPPGTYCRIQAPYELPEEFDLRLQVEKVRGSTLIMGLGGRHPVMLTLDGCGGNVSGLEAVDGKRLEQNETRWNGAVFRDGKKSTVVVSVRKGALTATVDDQRVVDYKGDRSRLSMPNDWQTSNAKALWIGSWEGVFQIDQAIVTPVGGSGVLLRKPAAAAAPEPVPPLPKGTIDLLALVDPVQDAVSGTWSMEDKTLVAKGGDHVRLVLPVIPPDEYDLRVVLERREGSDGIVFGLARASNQWTAFVDKLPTEGGHTGLEMVDNAQLTLQRGMQITTGQTMTFDFRVRRNGVTALKDGKPLFSWQGNTTRLGNYKNWAVPNPKALFLGQWWNTVRYMEVKLTPVSGEGRLLRGGAAPPLPKNAIDLLSAIDPQKDAVKGTWTIEPQGLICSSGDHIRLQIPYSPPDEYDLVMTVNRRDGADGLLVGLVKGSAQWSVTLDTQASGTFKSGFESLDGQGPSGNPSTYSGPVFANGRDTVLEFRVRKVGVTVVADGKAIIDWRGNFNRLSLPEGWKVRSPNALFLAAWGSRYQFSRIALIPVSGAGKKLR